MLLYMWSEIRTWYMSCNDCQWVNRSIELMDGLGAVKKVYVRTRSKLCHSLKVLWICERVMMSLFATDYSETLTSSWSSKRNTRPSKTNLAKYANARSISVNISDFGGLDWLDTWTTNWYSSPKKRSFPLFIRRVFTNSKVNGHAFDLSLVFSDVPCVIVRSDWMRTININWACNKLRENVFHV